MEREAKGEWCWFLNDDAWLEGSNWYSQLLKFDPKSKTKLDPEFWWTLEKYESRNFSWGGPFPILPRFFWKDLGMRSLKSPIDSWSHYLTVRDHGWDWDVLKDVTVIHDRSGDEVLEVERKHGTKSKVL